MKKGGEKKTVLKMGSLKEHISDRSKQFTSSPVLELPSAGSRKLPFPLPTCRQKVFIQYLGGIETYK